MTPFDRLAAPEIPIPVRPLQVTEVSLPSPSRLAEQLPGPVSEKPLKSIRTSSTDAEIPSSPDGTTRLLVSR